MSAELSDEEILRYNRQIILRNFDFDGQEKLKDSTVLIAGLGGLGCTVSHYLASAGVGKLHLLDFDTVSLSNLQRQILHRDNRIGMPKVESAKIALSEINPHGEYIAINQRLDNIDLISLMQSVDLVIDCTDNVGARNQLNQACYQIKKPLISGAAIRMEGQLSVFSYKKNEPCYRCLSKMFGERALSCSESGVMAPLVGIIGTMQAMEAIKLLTQFGEVITGRLLLLDALTLQFREMSLLKNPQCEVCNDNGK